MVKARNSASPWAALAACLMLAAVAAPAADDGDDARLDGLLKKLEGLENEIDVSIFMGRLSADELLALGRRICEKHPTAKDQDMGWLLGAEFAVQFWARKAKRGTKGKTIAGVLLDPEAPAEWRGRFLEHLDADPREDLLQLSKAEWVEVMSALEGLLTDRKQDVDTRREACDALVTRDTNEYESLLRKDPRLAKLFKKRDMDPKVKPDPWALASTLEFTGRLGGEIASLRARIRSRVDLLMSIVRDGEANPTLRSVAFGELRSYHVRWLPDAARIERFYFELYERRNDYPEDVRLDLLSTLYFALERRIRREAYEIANGAEDRAVRRDAAALLRRIYRPKPWERKRSGPGR